MVKTYKKKVDKMVDFVFTPIVNSSTDKKKYCFKVVGSNMLDLRIAKQEFIEYLEFKNYKCEKQAGWYEE